MSRAKKNGKTNGKSTARVVRPEHDAVHQLDMLDRAVTNLHALLDECEGDARRFRLLARGMTAHIRTVCNALDGHRSLDGLEGAARFALESLRASQANGHDYGTSALGQSTHKLASVVDP